MNEKWFVSSTDGHLYNTHRPDWAQHPTRRNYCHTFTTINTPRQLAATIRAGELACPGGYQMAFVASDGGLICFECARKEFRNIAYSIRLHIDDGWRIVGTTVLYESPDSDTTCDNCNRVLLSQDEPDEQRPEPGDYIIHDAGPLGSLTAVLISEGKPFGTFPSFDSAMRAIRADMDKQQFWPNVWTCSDHGNMSLVTDELPDEED
jgi:hypothetical protein